MVYVVVFIDRFTEVLLFLIFLRVILSWFRPNPLNPIVRFVYGVTQPIFNVVYRFFPSLKKSPLDISPIIAYFGIVFIRYVVIKLLLGQF